LIKIGQGEANENARAREVGGYINSTDESKSIETRNLFVILQYETSASKQVNRCPDARLDSCDTDGEINDVAGKRHGIPGKQYRQRTTCWRQINNEQ
jgi:hypothetical protein